MSDKINTVIALAELFNRQLSDAAAKLYVAALGDVSEEHLAKVTLMAAERFKFFPKPAELLELIKTSGVGYEAKAQLAYENLETALGHNKPSMMEPLTEAIVNQMGGFQHLWGMPLDKFHPWARKEFCEIYVTMVRENPERIAAITAGHSEFAQALVDHSNAGVPSREERQGIEQANRQKLQQISDMAHKENRDANH